jgi:hypothetical protein
MINLFAYLARAHPHVSEVDVGEGDGGGARGRSDVPSLCQRRLGRGELGDPGVLPQPHSRRGGDRLPVEPDRHGLARRHKPPHGRRHRVLEDLDVRTVGGGGGGGGAWWWSQADEDIEDTGASGQGRQAVAQFAPSIIPVRSNSRSQAMVSVDSASARWEEQSLVGRQQEWCHLLWVSRCLE